MTTYEIEHVTAALSDKPALAVPTVHLNGTSKESLLGGYCEAIAALHDAGRWLAAASPNERDYYVRWGTFQPAIREHEARMNKLREIIKELETIAKHVSDQGR
jgi:hypothetical protein